jgi:hypothetical protein
VTSDYGLSGDFGDQLDLDATTPIAGDLYRNVHDGWYACVLAVKKRRKRWYVIRFHDREREISPADFHEHFVKA